MMAKCKLPIGAVAAFIVLLSLDAAGDVTFTSGPGKLDIQIDGQAFATYVYEDPEIARPYFRDLYAPGGIKVTRNYPPIEGVDLTDHATYHPGLWIAFGDINGADFWRLKARVRQENMTTDAAKGAFTVTNAYESDGKVICRETCRFVVRTVPEGRLIQWESTFVPEGAAIAFGDQEEMGLGVRVATALTVKKGNGAITNSDGFKNEESAWGKQADWCDFSGEIDGQPAGVTLFTHPDNFRRSWFHARDYGLLVANPFGRKAFTEGEASREVVEPGQSFTLRFGVLVHGKVDSLSDAYRNYLTLEKQ